MVVKAWHMIPDEEVTSQFGLNYAGDISVADLQLQTGVTCHQVDFYPPRTKY